MWGITPLPPPFWAQAGLPRAQGLCFSPLRLPPPPAFPPRGSHRHRGPRGSIPPREALAGSLPLPPVVLLPPCRPVPHLLPPLLPCLPLPPFPVLILLLDLLLTVFLFPRDRLQLQWIRRSVGTVPARVLWAPVSRRRRGWTRKLLQGRWLTDCWDLLQRVSEAPLLCHLLPFRPPLPPLLLHLRVVKFQVPHTGRANWPGQWREQLRVGLGGGRRRGKGRQ